MDSSFSEHRLPPGRHGLTREFVADNQRWRLIGAAAEILAERGYGRISARLVVSRAAVSSSTFYRHFKSVPDLMMASFEVAAASLFEVVSQACRSTPARGQRLQPVFQAALLFAEEEPHLAHLLGFEAAAAVVEIAVARERLLERLAELTVAGGKRPPASSQAVAAALTLALGPSGTAAGLVELVDLLSALEITGWDRASARPGS